MHGGRGTYQVHQNALITELALQPLRFFGQTDITPTAQADVWRDEIILGINDVLKKAAQAPSFVEALYSGVFGDKADGVYPGRAGRDSITEVAPTKKLGRWDVNPVMARKISLIAAAARPAVAARRRRR